MREMIFINKIKKFIFGLFFSLALFGRGPAGRFANHFSMGRPISGNCFGRNFASRGYGRGRWGGGWNRPLPWNVGVPYNWYGPAYTPWGPYGPWGYPSGIYYSISNEYVYPECCDEDESEEESLKARQSRKYSKYEDELFDEDDSELEEMNEGQK